MRYDQVCLGGRDPERDRRCGDRHASGGHAGAVLAPFGAHTLAGLESLSEPHVRHLEGKLWELRLTGRDGIARALYVTAIARRVIVVRAFVKKTQKTPRAEICLALRRAKEIA